MDEKAESTKEAPAPAPAAAPRGGSKVTTLLMLINTIAVGGVVVYLATHRLKPATQAAAERPAAHTPAAAPASPEPGPMLRIDSIIVQLQSAETDKYAHLSVELELNSEADKHALDVRLPHLRDAIISFLADRNVEEMAGSHGIAQLKAALRKEVERLVPGKGLREVFVTQFLVQ